jgi:glyoxylase I family protein
VQLDHFTIRTRDLAATKAFFTAVFDLEERPRPAAIQRIPGHWLYSGKSPLVHLIQGHGEGADLGSETIDHVGIRLEGYAAFRSKLDRLGIRYSLMDLPELDERRVFFRAPGGTLLEAVFTEPMPAATAH